MKGVWIALCSLLLTACNSLFYHPDKISYSLPEQIAPNYMEHRIPVGAQGENLHAWHFRTGKVKKGTVLHFHGNAQNMSAHVFFVAWLLDEGYDLVTFDYRGYGKSDGEVNRANTVQDGVSVLKWAAANIESENLIVVGQSLGGAVALVAVAKSEVRAVKKLVLDSTFHSYRKLAQRKLASFYLTWPLQWPLSFLVTDSYSPRASLDKFKEASLPIFIVHDDQDPVVPYSEGEQLANDLKSLLGSQVHFRTESSKGHTVCMHPRNQSACMKAVAGFLGEEIPAQKSSETQNP